MDAFESLVAGVLQRRERLWVWQNFKIELSAAQKAALGKPSHPRIDVDVLAYDAVENRVLWVECKSYLDSSGVSVSAFDGTNPKFGERFKVFTDARYREVAAEALIAQLVQQG